MGAWLRRLFHRPPTVQDCIRAALRAPCEPTKAPEPWRDPVTGEVDWVARTKAAHEAHRARYMNDAPGFPVVEWGEFTPEDV